MVLKIQEAHFAVWLKCNWLYFIIDSRIVFFLNLLIRVGVEYNQKVCIGHVYEF